MRAEYDRSVGEEWLESEEYLRGGGVLKVFNLDITDLARIRPELRCDFVVSYCMAPGR